MTNESGRASQWIRGRKPGNAVIILVCLAIMAGCEQDQRQGRDMELVLSGEDAAMHPVADADFDTIVLGSKRPVLVDFWADWCGPCHLLAPILNQFAHSVDGSAVIAKVNVDENPNLAEEYEIDSLPTLVIFYRGEEVDRLVGVVDQATLQAALKPWIERDAISPDTSRASPQ